MISIAVRQSLTHTTDEQLKDMIDELLEYETDGEKLKGGAVRALVVTASKETGETFNEQVHPVVNAVWREAALRWSDQ